MSWKVDIGVNFQRFTLRVALAGDVEPVIVIGPNGSGKTTLLQSIVGGCRPDMGRIDVGGVCVFDRDEGIDCAPEQRRVGYVPQGFGLFPHLDALDNVGFSLLGTGSRTHRRGVALAALERFGCAQIGNAYPAHLSGGERQQVALARAVVAEPSILLLDEPLSALDVVARQRTRAWLVQYLREHRGPSIVVTHDVRDVLALEGEVVVLEQGKVVQRGDALALANAPATEFVDAFFGEA